MKWVLVLLMSTTVPGKPDVKLKWDMPTQAICQQSVTGARILSPAGGATVWTACVQEPK